MCEADEDLACYNIKTMQHKNSYTIKVAYALHAANVFSKYETFILKPASHDKSWQ